MRLSKAVPNKPKNSKIASDALLYYNIVTTERSPSKRKIKPRDYVTPTESQDDEEDDDFCVDDLNDED